MGEPDTCWASSACWPRGAGAGAWGTWPPARPSRSAPDEPPGDPAVVVLLGDGDLGGLLPRLRGAVEGVALLRLHVVGAAHAHALQMELLLEALLDLRLRLVGVDDLAATGRECERSGQRHDGEPAH